MYEGLSVVVGCFLPVSVLPSKTIQVLEVVACRKDKEGTAIVCVVWLQWAFMEESKKYVGGLSKLPVTQIIIPGELPWPWLRNLCCLARQPVSEGGFWAPKAGPGPLFESTTSYVAEAR